MIDDNRKILGPLIKKIHWHIDKTINEAVRECDLTTTQSEILRYLEHMEYKGVAVSQKDIEKHLNISNPTVSGVLDRMEDKGFIERVTDKNDARKKIVILTDKARDINKQIIVRLDDFDDYMTSCLSNEERDQLFDYLERIIINFKKKGDR